jgi:ribosomal protein S18 acetylase RimI-like enzyme
MRRHATALHLQIIGTAPAMQSKGLGGTLIEVGFARAEARGVPCYFESTNPRNVPFYERHGFVVLEEY